MNAQIAQVDDLKLIAAQSAVNCTELFVRFTLTEWSLRPLVEDALPPASQLVQAAVDSADADAPGFLNVRLQLRGESLVVEVEDDQIPAPNAAAPAIEGGRSGIVPLDGRGKLSWCELPLPNGQDASSIPLPQRERRRSAAAERMNEEPDDVDPAVMERLLSGLSRGSHAQPD